MAQVEIEEKINVPEVKITVRSDESLLNLDLINTVSKVYDLAGKYRGKPKESKSFPERNGERMAGEFCLIFPNRGCMSQFCDELGDT